jgi:hypothetical protein
VLRQRALNPDEYWRFRKCDIRAATAFAFSCETNAPEFTPAKIQNVKPINSFTF